MALGFVYYKDFTAANDCGSAAFCPREPGAGWRWQTTATLQVFPNVKHDKGEKGRLSLQITWKLELKPNHTGRRIN